MGGSSIEAGGVVEWTPLSGEEPNHMSEGDEDTLVVGNGNDNVADRLAQIAGVSALGGK